MKKKQPRLLLVAVLTLSAVEVSAHDIERTRVALTFSRDGSFVLDVANDPNWLTQRLERFVPAGPKGPALQNPFAPADSKGPALQNPFAPAGSKGPALQNPFAPAGSKGPALQNPFAPAGSKGPALQNPFAPAGPKGPALRDLGAVFIDRVVLWVDGREIRPASVEYVAPPSTAPGDLAALSIYRMRGRMPIDARTLRWYYGLVIDPYPLTIHRADGRILVEEIAGDAWSGTIDLSGQFRASPFNGMLASIVIVVALLIVPLAMRIVGSRRVRKDPAYTS